MKLGGIDLLALYPFDQVGRTIRWVGAPSLEHTDVNGLVDGGMATVLPSLRFLADGSKKGRRNLGVQSPPELLRRFGNLRRQSIAVQSDVRTKREPVRFRLLHHPAQRGLGKKISLIAASYVGMGPHKPALLDGGQWARRRDDRVWILWVTDGPQGGCEVVAMLVDSKGVITVQDMDA